MGLCHGLYETLWLLQALFGLDSVKDIQCTYAGVNHFFITSFSIRAEDGFTLLRKKMPGKSLPELVAEFRPDAVHCYLADELYRFTGCLTYLSDRQPWEFLPQFITSEETLARHHIHRTTIEERKQGIRQAELRVERMMEGTIPERYHRRPRETAADIINSFVAGREFIDVGNVPNVGQVANLPLGSIVETPVLVTGSGFRPIIVGCLPEPVRSWIERIAHVEGLPAEAATEGDLDKAIKALALDPVVSHLGLARSKSSGCAC